MHWFASAPRASRCSTVSAAQCRAVFLSRDGCAATSAQDTNESLVLCCVCAQWASKRRRFTRPESSRATSRANAATAQATAASRTQRRRTVCRPASTRARRTCHCRRSAWRRTRDGARGIIRCACNYSYSLAALCALSSHMLIAWPTAEHWTGHCCSTRMYSTVQSSVVFCTAQQECVRREDSASSCLPLASDLMPLLHCTVQ